MQVLIIRTFRDETAETPCDISEEEEIFAEFGTNEFLKYSVTGGES